MPNALVLLAPGFEEIEAVAVIDVLRRAEVSVTTAALVSQLVEGAHGIAVQADQLLDAVLDVAFDAVVLPGGQPGSRHLRDDKRVRALLIRQNESGRLVAAICAAPSVLEAAGLLNGRSATSFPGVELPSAIYETKRVVEDGNLVTSRAAGTAIEFALALVQRLVGADAATKLRQGMVVA